MATSKIFTALVAFAVLPTGQLLGQQAQSREQYLYVLRVAQHYPYAVALRSATWKP